VGIALLAAVFFNRFDPSRERVTRQQGDEVIEAASEGDFQTTVTVSPLQPVTLSPVSTRFTFGAVLRAELRLMLQGQRWWWYGVAVILHAAADRVVPAEQVAPLRQGIRTFLLASQLTLVDMKEANATFATAREMVKALPEPSATYLTYVNERNVKALGQVLVPHLGLEADPAASPERTASAPAAPVFLLHGDGDTVIPTAESAVLADYLRAKGVGVHLLISRIITHAELDRSAAAAEIWRLIAFWAEVLRR